MSDICVDDVIDPCEKEDDEFDLYYDINDDCDDHIWSEMSYRRYAKTDRWNNVEPVEESLEDEI